MAGRHHFRVGGPYNEKLENSGWLRALELRLMHMAGVDNQVSGDAEVSGGKRGSHRAREGCPRGNKQVAVDRRSEEANPSRTMTIRSRDITIQKVFDERPT